MHGLVTSFQRKVLQIDLVSYKQNVTFFFWYIAAKLKAGPRARTSPWLFGHFKSVRHVGFVLPKNHCSKVFGGCSSLSRNNVCKKLSFRCGIFFSLSLNDKQKKHYHFAEQQTSRLFMLCSTES